MSDNNPNEALAKQINLMLGALIVLAGTVAAFLFFQARHLRHDLNAIRPVHAAVVQAYNNDKPAVDAFVVKLANYGREHADFAPIMKKYQLQQVTNAAPVAKSPVATSSPPAKVTPAPAPAPKK